MKRLSVPCIARWLKCLVVVLACVYLAGCEEYNDDNLFFQIARFFLDS